MTQIVELNVSDVVFREDLYPRIKKSPEKIQEYAENLEVLPPIEVNQHNELIDGYHRWTAHKKAEATIIRVVITETTSDIEFEKLSYLRNASHGLQLSREDKKRYATNHYGKGETKEEIAEILSVTVKTVSSWVEDIDRSMREERNRIIREMWLACHTQEEIAQKVGVTDQTIGNYAKSLNTEEFPNLEISDNSDESSKDTEKNPFKGWPKDRLAASQFPVKYGKPNKDGESPETEDDYDWKRQLYNIWSFGKKTNAVEHPGNTEQRIVDNLLYMFTEPFDIVVDPFAGGGSTIDVCQRRLRRYWVSDRKPPQEREDVRQHDILNGPPPLHKRWQDVSLVYLDPPYWRQVAGEYSEDIEDLANMGLEDFYVALIKFISACAKKMCNGSYIALIIQPTQWLAEDRRYPEDHVVDLIMRLSKNKRLCYKNRIICPYQTQQYNAQQVIWAKENKEVLTINRELILWSVVKNDDEETEDQGALP